MGYSSLNTVELLQIVRGVLYVCVFSNQYTPEVQILSCSSLLQFLVLKKDSLCKMRLATTA